MKRFWAAWKKLDVRTKVRLLRLFTFAQRIAAIPFGSRLDLLARIFKTDKSTRHHGYTMWYVRHLPARSRVTSLLEIGIGGLGSGAGYDTEFGGQSLRVWQRYFPKARIVGLDLMRKRVSGRRITVEQGSQDDKEVLAAVARRHGPFDVVIDDGSHVGRHVEASFVALFPHVAPGGVYVIEDLATAYAPEYEGGTPGTPGTQIELIGQLLHDLMRRHWDETGMAHPISAMHIYDEIAFIHKA